MKNAINKLSARVLHSLRGAWRVVAARGAWHVMSPTNGGPRGSNRAARRALNRAARSN